MRSTFALPSRLATRHFATKQATTTRLATCCSYGCNNTIQQWTNNTNDTQTQKQYRNLSTFTRGQDLLADSLSFGSRRKIILDSTSPTGVDVYGMLEYPPEESPTSDTKNNERGNERNGEEPAVPITPEEKPQILHMNGSILALPHTCLLWNVRTSKDVTYESLSFLLLTEPSIELLFIGTDVPIPMEEMDRIRGEFRKRGGVVVEQMDLTNACGTFNILNGEDRRIAAALVLNAHDDDDGSDQSDIDKGNI